MLAQLWVVLEPAVLGFEERFDGFDHRVGHFTILFVYCRRFSSPMLDRHRRYALLERPCFFARALGGIDEEISIRRTLSQRYERYSYPRLCNLVSHLLHP